MRSVLVATALFVALSLVYTYPMVLEPSAANRFDSYDALLNAWILSWDLHQLACGRVDLFNANIFYPEENTLALSDNLLTAAVLVLPFRLFTDNPILLANMALLMALVSGALAAFVLARSTWGSLHGAVLAGVVFGFGSYHWGHITHLQLQWTFALPMAFYFAGRIAEGAGLRAALGLALSMAAAFGSSGYYAVYLLTALPVLAAAGFSFTTANKKRMAAKWAVAGAGGVLFSLPLVWPYVQQFNQGHRRSVETMARYSADARAYVTSLSRLHGFLPKGEEALFLGFAASGLIAYGLLRSAKGRAHRRRLLPWVLVGLVGVALSLGPGFAPLAWLYRTPAYRGLRVPSRAGVLFLLAGAMLAAYGLSRVRSKRWRVVVLLVAAAECYAGPLYWSFDPPRVPPVYRHVAEERGALIELPFPHPDQFYRNALYVYRSVYHWKPLVNGYSGFVPESYRRTHRLLTEGDFPRALVHLGEQGVRLLLAHSTRLGPRTLRKIAEAERAGLLEPVQVSGPDRLYRIVAEGRAED